MPKDPRYQPEPLQGKGLDARVTRRGMLVYTVGLALCFVLVIGGFTWGGIQIVKLIGENGQSITRISTDEKRLNRIEHPTPKQLSAAVLVALHRCRRDPKCFQLFRAVASGRNDRATARRIARLERRANGARALHRPSPSPGLPPTTRRPRVRPRPSHRGTSSPPPSHPAPPPGGPPYSPPPPPPVSPPPPVTLTVPLAPPVCTPVVHVNC